MKAKWLCLLPACALCFAAAYAAAPQNPQGSAHTADTGAAAAEARPTGSAGQQSWFTDVPADSWYAPQLRELVSRGAVEVTGAFSPYEPVTVREYIELLVRCTAPEEVLARYSGSADQCLLAGKETGMLAGFDCSQARLAKPLARCEAAWLLASAARCGGETLAVPEGIERALRDYRALSATYRDAVGQAFGAGLLTGYSDRTFRDTAAVRRCDAAVSVVRLLDRSQRAEVLIPDYDYGAPVPAGAAADDSFFADAVFIGDSLCDGFGEFSGLKQGTFMGVTSLNVFKVWDGGREQVFREKQFGKIYIMLGINEIGYGTEKVAQAYQKMVEKFQALQPQADIYVQSLLPVCESKLSAADKRNHVTNGHVRELNTALQRVSEECGAYFVNVHEAFADANGGLPPEKCWDGVHLNVTGYQEWLAYLRTHAVMPASESGS